MYRHQLTQELNPIEDGCYTLAICFHDGSIYQAWKEKYMDETYIDLMLSELFRT
jgi:hypothetical protein